MTPIDVLGTNYFIKQHLYWRDHILKRWGGNIFVPTPKVLYTYSQVGVSDAYQNVVQLLSDGTLRLFAGSVLPQSVGSPYPKEQVDPVLFFAQHPAQTDNTVTAAVHWLYSMTTAQDKCYISYIDTNSERPCFGAGELPYDNGRALFGLFTI